MINHFFKNSGLLYGPKAYKAPLKILAHTWHLELGSQTGREGEKIASR